MKHMKTYKQINENDSIERHKLENTPLSGKYGDHEYPMERIRNNINGILHIITSLQDINDTEYENLPDELLRIIRYSKKFDIDELINYINDEELVVDMEKIKKWFKL